MSDEGEGPLRSSEKTDSREDGIARPDAEAAPFSDAPAEFEAEAFAVAPEICASGEPAPVTETMAGCASEPDPVAGTAVGCAFEPEPMAETATGFPPVEFWAETFFSEEEFPAEAEFLVVAFPAEAEFLVVAFPAEAEFPPTAVFPIATAFPAAAGLPAAGLPAPTTALFAPGSFSPTFSIFSTGALSGEDDAFSPSEPDFFRQKNRIRAQRIRAATITISFFMDAGLSTPARSPPRTRIINC